MEEGSVGDKFYIILQGTVTVQVPNETYKRNIQIMIKEEVLKLVLQAGKNKGQEMAPQIDLLRNEVLAKAGIDDA